MSLQKTLAAFALALTLGAAVSGCGFSPLYGSGGPSGGGGSLVGPVTVDEVKGKAGHVFRAEMGKLLQLEQGPGPSRRLKVAISESVSGLGFRVDESATRSDLTLVSAYSLIDENEKTIASGSATATASYDVAASAYGELAAQADARERAAENLALMILSKLNLQLSQAQAQNASARP